MIPYFQALFIQRHGMISALMIYGPATFDNLYSFYLLQQSNDLPSLP